MAADVRSEQDDVFLEEPPEDLRCPICLQVLRNPVQTACGHRFCSDCIGPVVASPKCKCPVCRIDISEGTFPDNAVKMQIRRLKIRCPNHAKGCEWLGDLSDKPTHLQHCTFMERVCEMCNKVVPLPQLEAHRSQCPRRPEQCQFCLESMPRCELDDHRDRCPKTPQPCPRHCSAAMIPRDAMEHHLSHDCPLEVVSCSMAEFGCQELIARGKLDAHVIRCAPQRVSILARVVLEQRKEMKRLHELMETQSTRLQELEEISYPSHGQFTWKIAHVREKISKAQDNPEGADAVVYSPAFFTGEAGYKLCLCVYPAGDNNQGCLSLYFVVMKGPYDEILPWPFQRRVCLSLINTRGGQNIVKEIVPDPRLHYFSRPRDTRNVGYGYPKFMPLAKLQSQDSEYVAGGAIFMRVTITS